MPPSSTSVSACSLLAQDFRTKAPWPPSCHAWSHDPAAQKPVYFDLTPARINDITAAKCLLPIEPGATYVFDLGYYDFAWWAGLAPPAAPSSPG